MLDHSKGQHMHAERQRAYAPHMETPVLTRMGSTLVLLDGVP